MNQLPPEKRARALHMLCEGSSMASTMRVLGTSENTITRLLTEGATTSAAWCPPWRTVDSMLRLRSMQSFKPPSSGAAKT